MDIIKKQIIDSKLLVKVKIEGNIYRFEIDNPKIDLASDEFAQLVMNEYSVIKNAELNPPSPDYRELRRTAYASDLGDWSSQLDMMYWDSINGTTLWQNKISEIKKQIPKI
jgi:hypothetical protein